MEELENEISTQAEENTVSLASAQALADALAKIEVYTPTTWVDNSSPDIDAEHLNKPEQAIKRVTDALNSAVDVIKDLQSQITKNSGAISDVNNNLSNSHKTVRTTTDITTGTNILKLDPGLYSYEDNNASDEQKLAMGFPQPMWHSEITVTGSWADNNKSTGYINIVVRDCSGDTPHIYENLYSWNKWRGWQSYALKSDLIGRSIYIAADGRTQNFNIGNNGFLFIPYTSITFGIYYLGTDSAKLILGTEDSDFKVSISGTTCMLQNNKGWNIFCVFITGQ